MNQIITIGREFGSGGRELGRLLAEKLKIAYYDQEIIIEISKRTELAEGYVQHLVEQVPAFPIATHVGRSFYPTINPVFEQRAAIYVEQHKLLQEFSQKSSCVIVGRCADYILKDKAPFRIFVYADYESKLRRCRERATQEEQLSEQEMKRKIAEIDKGRARYYEFYSDQKWGARQNYDLMVNTSYADLEKIAAAVSRYIE